MRFFSSLARGLAGVGLALALLPAPASAQEVKILFVGNSFTHGKFRPVLNYQAAPGGVTDENANAAGTPRAEITFGEPGPYGGIPGIFKRFTLAAGLNYDVHLETISGQGLSTHVTNALPIIAQAQWNVVVLQELSNRPLPTGRGGNQDQFNTAVNQLESAIHAQNSSAQIYLYQTWARADQTYTPSGVYFGEPIETMGNDLIAGYQAAFNQNANLTDVIPAGAAWLLAINGASGLNPVAVRNPYTQLTGLSLWGVDFYHPSRHGAYLNALVIFSRVTRLDPNNPGFAAPFDAVAADLGITPAEAASLRQVASQFTPPPPPSPLARPAAK